MKVSIYLADGRVRTYDTQGFLSAGAYSSLNPSYRNHPVFISEETLRMDLLEEEGLVVDLCYFSSYEVEGESGQAVQVDDPIYSSPLSIGSRHPGRRFVLLKKEAVKNIVKIVADGELAAWREDDWIVNGVKFNNAVRLYGDPEERNLHLQVALLYDFLRNTKYPSPEITDEEICAIFGYNKVLVDEAISGAYAQAAGGREEDGTATPPAKPEEKTPETDSPMANDTATSVDEDALGLRLHDSPNGLGELEKVFADTLAGLGTSAPAGGDTMPAAD